MKRAMQAALVAMIATQALVIGQVDVTRVLADTRAALGGAAKLDEVKTLSIEGTSTRPAPDGTSRETPFAMAMELPDKFAKREVLGNINGMEISRTSGFAGATLVDRTDTPPQMSGMVMLRRPGDAAGADASPEAEARARASALQASRREFARLSLGLFAASMPVYPVDFSYAGQAESPDGKADMIDVKNADGFAARLFIDAGTHLPLMLSWMDKEPLRLEMSAGAGRGQVQASGGHAVQTMRGAMSREDMDRMRQEMAEQMKEAEARRRVVEHRMFYADYKAFDGIRLPTRVQRMIDGSPVEEIALQKVKVNGRIDPRLFEASKQP